MRAGCPDAQPLLRGFTFVEILAALAFLAILIPAVVGALTVSNRAAVLAERTSLAAELAQNQLNQLMVNNAWQSAGTSGDFGEEFPGYHWQMDQTSWSGDATTPMTQLTMRVTFTAQGQSREINLTTLVSTTASQGQSTGSSGSSTPSTPSTSTGS